MIVLFAWVVLLAVVPLSAAIDWVAERRETRAARGDEGLRSHARSPLAGRPARSEGRPAAVFPRRNLAGTRAICG